MIAQVAGWIGLLMLAGCMICLLVAMISLIIFTMRS